MFLATDAMSSRRGGVFWRSAAGRCRGVLRPGSISIYLFVYLSVCLFRGSGCFMGDHSLLDVRVGSGRLGVAMCLCTSGVYKMGVILFTVMYVYMCVCMCMCSVQTKRRCRILKVDIEWPGMAEIDSGYRCRCRHMYSGVLRICQ